MSGERCIRAEKEKEDGIKLAKSTISMDVGSDNTVFLFASLGLRQLTTDPGKKKKKFQEGTGEKGMESGQQKKH